MTPAKKIIALVWFYCWIGPLFWVRAKGPLHWKLKMWRRVEICRSCGRKYRYFCEVACDSNQCGLCGLPWAVADDKKGVNWMRSRFRVWLVS